MNLTLSVGKMRISHICIRATTKGSGMDSTERQVKMRLNIRITDYPKIPSQNQHNWAINNSSSQKKTEGLILGQYKSKNV